MKKTISIIILIILVFFGLLFREPLMLAIKDNVNDERIQDIHKRIEQIFISGTGTLVENVSETAVNTGEEYTFPEETYIYRTMLNEKSQKVYNQVYSNALKLNDSFTLITNLNEEEIGRVMTALYNDHPELFWLSTEYSYGFTVEKNVVSVSLKFNNTADDIEGSKRSFENALDLVIKGTAEMKSDFEKEKYVHDFLVDTVTYDENSVLNQSAYSAIVNGKSVCAGYSRAFQLIMTKLGIPCYYCAGYANNESHAWNIVMINGKAYNVDISWNDSDEEAGIGRYNYFNITDQMIEKDHKRLDMSVDLPKCISADLMISEK